MDTLAIFHVKIGCYQTSRVKQTMQLGLGGGCHWCTEAIFSSLIGINKVQQGWLASHAPANNLSEGILLDPPPLPLFTSLTSRSYAHRSWQSYITL